MWLNQAIKKKLKKNLKWRLACTKYKNKQETRNINNSI